MPKNSSFDWPELYALIHYILILHLLKNAESNADAKNIVVQQAPVR